ncbi:MAG TPA: TonB-dependent receptor plug domain-containing protein [Spirochaetota bacterium]|nr:TonB-dependent receptor plug domain-containing protein [Spirochaetota bacterium]HSA15062.1 TonB-dependent receptor plug domain-containing protein [Spirochaetota bacterium]
MTRRRLFAKSSVLETVLLILIASCSVLFAQSKEPEQGQKNNGAQVTASPATVDSPAVNAAESETQTDDGKKKQRKRGVALSEIIIRNRAISIIEDASSTTVITDEQIKAHSDKTLEDSLKMVPGLQVENHRKGYVRARVRGMDQDKLALLVDGIPVNDVYSTDIDISSIPVINISSIVINRGAVSALYGAKGASGVINVVTARPDRLFAEASVEYGQYDNLTASFAQGMPVKKFYYWLTGSIVRSGGYYASAALDSGERKKWFNKFVRYNLYPDPANGGAPYTYDAVAIPAKNDYVEDDGLVDHNSYTMYSVSGKAGYSFSDDIEAGLSVRYTYKTGRTSSFQANAFSNYKESEGGWNDDPVFVIVNDEDIKQAAFRNRSFVWPGIHNLGVSPYLTVTGKRFNFRGALFYTYQKAEQIGYASTDHSFVKDGALAGTAYEPHYEIKKYHAYGCNLYPSWRLAKWNKLTLGTLLTVSSYREEEALSGDESPLIAATIFGTDPYPIKELESLYFSVALEDEMVFWDRLHITLGLSYDMQYFYRFKYREALYQYEDAYIVREDPALLGTRDSFNPVLGLIGDIVPGLMRVRAAGSMKTRFPNLSEYEKIVNDRRDHSLRPERAYNAGCGLEFILAEDMVTARADYFYTAVDDRIVKISGGIDPPVNIDRVESQGLELLLTYTHKNVGGMADIQLQASYVYLHARARDDTPEESVNKGELLEYTPAHQVSFDFRVRFISGTSLALWGYSTINQIAYAMRSRPEIGASGYSTSYFQAVNLHDPVMMSIKISQEFLKHYTVFVMCRNILDDYNADPFTPGPGRMFYGGLSASF